MPRLFTIHKKRAMESSGGDVACVMVFESKETSVVDLSFDCTSFLFYLFNYFCVMDI